MSDFLNRSIDFGQKIAVKSKQKDVMSPEVTMHNYLNINSPVLETIKNTVKNDNKLSVSIDLNQYFFNMPMHKRVSKKQALQVNFKLISLSYR